MDCKHGVPLPLHCGACFAQEHRGGVDPLPSYLDPEPTGIEATLAERGNRYGDFTHHARIAQAIQDVMRAEATGWAALAPDQRQALTVIADKIARMLNGDPNYRDNWHDIVGYAKLVDDRLLADEEHAANGPELPLAPPINLAQIAQLKHRSNENG